MAKIVVAALEPLDEEGIAAPSSARGRWRERLPTLLDTRATIGRIPGDQGRHTTD